MSMFTDLTPAQLADALDEMGRYPHNTGGLSMLDEATLAYGWRYPDIDGPQRAFATARHAHMRSYRTETGNYTDESWQQAMEAARALAAVLRPLGNARIERCKRPALWGTCNRPLPAHGVCRGDDHTDAEAKEAAR